MKKDLIPALRVLFNVREGEERLVTLLLLHSLLYGAAISFSYTASMAIFLATFSADLLPWVFIVAALIIALSGAVYSRLERRLAFGPLFLLTLGFIVAGLIFFRGGLLMAQAGWLAFGVLIWFRLLYSLTGLEFWGLAGRLLTLQQGKRLFGVIGTGEVLAKVVGFLLIPLLVLWIGTPNLLLLAAACIGGNMLLLLLLLRDNDAATLDDAQPAHSAAPAPAALQHPLRLRYVQLIAVASIFSMLLYFLTDFGFMQQLRTRLSDTDQIASFLAIFKSAAYAGGFLMRALLSSRLLARFGLRTGVITLPLALMLPLLAIALFGSLGVYLGAIFWLMMLTRLLNDLLNTGLYRASFVLLYQPLPLAQRLSAQAVTESMFEPLGIGLAGVLLLLFQRAPAFSITLLAALMFVLTLGWLGVVLWTYRHYVQSLLQALATRTLGDGGLSLDDGVSAAIVKRKLDGEHAGEIVYALDLLEQTGVQVETERLQQLLLHPDPLLRMRALQFAGSHHVDALLPQIIERAQSDIDRHTRAAAMRVWTQLDPDDAVQHLLLYLDGHDQQLLEAALVAILYSGGLSGVLAGGNHLLQLAASSDANERVSAARVLGALGVANYYRPLLPLLQDPSPLVVPQALHAAGAIGNPKLWPLALNHLKAGDYAPAAAAALEQGGESVLPLLATTLATAADDSRLALRSVRIIGRIGGDQAQALLVQQLNAGCSEVRGEALRWLSKLGYRPDGDAQALVEQQLLHEVQGAYNILLCVQLQPDNGLLLSSLQDELQRVIFRIFYLLTFFHSRKTLLLARDTIYYAGVDRRGYALELLSNLLTPQQRTLLLTLLDDLSNAQRLQQLRAVLQLSAEAPPLRALLAFDSPHLADWTKACAIYTMFDPNHDANHRYLQSAQHAPQPLVREAAIWRLSSTPSQLDDQRLPAPLVFGDSQMLSTLEKVFILKTVDIFAGSSDAILAEIAQLLAVQSVNAGEPIFEYGDAGASMYIIAAGRVHVHVGDRPLNDLGERQVFGEMAVLDPAPRMASVTAVEPTVLLRLDQETLFELMESRSEVARGIIRVLIRRLRDRVNELNEARAQLQAAGTRQMDEVVA